MYLSLVVPCLLAVSVYAGQATSSTIPASSNSSLVPSGQCSDAETFFINKCSICKYVIKTVKEIVGSDFTVEVLKAALNTICDKIPFVSTSCKHFVDTYGDEVSEYIRNKMDAKTICRKISLCSSLTLGYNANRHHVGVGNAAVSSGCAMCKMVKLVIDEVKLKGKGEDDVSEAVERACHGFRSETKQVCASMAAILQNVPLSSSPVDACGAICYSPQQSSVTYANAANRHVDENVAITCDQCTPIVDNIRQRVQNQTEHEIVDYLDVYCMDVPARLIPTCFTYLAGFQSAFGDHIVAGSSSKATCQAIRMC